MRIFIAKETEYQKAQAFYHELISKMQAHPYRPTWVIGTYPNDDYLMSTEQLKNVVIPRRSADSMI